MNESVLLSGVLVAGVLAEALRVAKRGQLLVSRAWVGRAYRPAALVFGNDAREFRAIGVPPAGPALRFGGADPAPRVPRDLAAVTALRERVRELEEGTGLLQWAGRALFVHLVVLTPVVLLAGIVPYRWWVAGSVLLVLQAVVLTAFWRAHRRFHPRERGERAQHLVNLLVFPPAGVYAADFVVGDLFADVHPLTGMLAVMDPAEATARAGALWRQWEHPVPGDDAIASAEERTALASVLEACGIGVATFCAPPERDGSGSRAYCPRCLAQFAVAGDDCPDCPGVARRPFR